MSLDNHTNIEREYNNKIINDAQIKNELAQNPHAMQDYYNQIKEPKPIDGKEVLNNGESKVPEFELTDILTLGLTYLLKLLSQGAEDVEQFKKDEPQIAENCKRNNIDYVIDNEKDNIKDISNGIGLYHDINELKKQLKQNPNDEKLKAELEKKQNKLNQLCQSNQTLNTLINSDKPSCAMANGMFHKAIIASKINQNGEKEFYLIDQGGRNVPGSGFPSDNDLSKNGINVMQVASTNGMCVATANAGLQNISQNGLDNFIDRYAGCVQQSARQNVNHQQYQQERMADNLQAVQKQQHYITNDNRLKNAMKTIKKQNQQTNNIQIGEIQNVDSSNIKQSSGMSIKTNIKGRGVV